MTMEGDEDAFQGSTDMQPEPWWDENCEPLNEGIQSPNGSWTYLESLNGSLSHAYMASNPRVNNRLARPSPGADSYDLVSSRSSFSVISLNNAIAFQEPFSATETAQTNSAQYMVNETLSNRQLVSSVQDGGVAYTQVCDFGSTLQPLNDTPRLPSSQSYNATAGSDPCSHMSPWPQHSALGQHLTYMQELVPSPQSSVKGFDLQTAISQDVAIRYSQPYTGSGWPASRVVTSEPSNIGYPIPLGFAPSSPPPGGCLPGLANGSLYPYLEQPLTACVNADPWHPLGLADHDVQLSAYHVQGDHALQNDRSAARRLRKAPIAIAPRPFNRAQATCSDKPKGQGSRRRGSLGISKRAEILQTREKGACWVCALQKDPCGPERTCKRCALREQRGQANLLGCVRTQLQEMTTTFLPVSMTKMHQRDEIITYIQDRLTGWTNSEDSSGIEVHLTTGFGPPFKWTLHEFIPAWPEVLSRYQHRTDDDGKTWYRTTTLSPPLGLKKLDKTDKHFLNKHIKDMTINHLDDFRHACFEGEDSFKARLTSLLCSLCASLPPRSPVGTSSLIFGHLWLKLNTG
ncbi:hypothetical protein BDV97DRAFT_99515 [Delphinella strobiligena]|nr:hypothetical protein BDV97DRAFT_99515 [Delphinella strobiligena]